MERVWLLFLDLDGTLWDHKDISSLTPPFKRINDEVIVDSRGVEVNLYGDMVKLLKWAKERGAIVSSLSWNDPRKALEALKAFNLLGLFDYHAIEVHPNKGEYASRVVDTVESRLGVKLRGCQIVYIDDRDIHLDNVKRHLGEIIFLRAWVDFKDYNEARRIIEERLCLDT
ncbi:MAG: magnesium-dependent phosphatase-1 [Desulfurococcales archaeon]|nr:magnesium-dependent phosphatase-1 [Desulfurococcales archaeon]